MRKLIDRLTRRALRDGLRRGLLGGSDVWLAIGALGLLVKVLAKKDAPKVVSERLRLGESITVTHLPPEPSRRAARKATKANRDLALETN
jgi:hypothetical protein